MPDFPSLHNDTNEFSVILLLDSISTKKVNRVRELVPPSPVRVDPPHVTLLRGISSSAYMSDQKLKVFIQQFILTNHFSEMRAHVKLIHNHQSHLYGVSSTIELEANQALKSARAALITMLQQNNFTISPPEIQHFRAHSTIALSSALDPSQDFSTIISSGDAINFSGIALLRLQNAPKDSPRQMRLLKI